MGAVRYRARTELRGRWRALLALALLAGIAGAASIAALFLTTEAVIADKPEKAAPGGAPGGMPGGDMDF